MYLPIENKFLATSNVTPEHIRVQKYSFVSVNSAHLNCYPLKKSLKVYYQHVATKIRERK